jgi:hypothetical protein
MNLIDETYFTGKIPLPGLRAKSEATGMDKLLNELTVSGLNLTQFISECQTEYLQKMLGEKLAGHFLENIPKEEPDEIWTELKDRLIDGKLKISPIANYVYFFILRYSVTQTSISGEKKGKSDNANNASVMHKSVFAWNGMVEMNERFARWFFERQNDYSPYMDEWRPDDDLFKNENIFNI